MAKKTIDEILDGVDATIVELQAYITTEADAIDALAVEIGTLSTTKDAAVAELEKAQRKLSDLQNLTNTP